ncbi:MAG: response regulator [Verrucomicrobia bacterium]|nr:response regulator [Verrucomicrobiota bacterium]
MPHPPLISIVDDDDALRSSTENLIRSAGFRTQGFSSAEAFLSANGLGETACLILDLRLPGMNGLDLQTHLNSNNRRIPTIFITAHGDETWRTRALAAGALAFLQKPFYEQDLLDAIDAALSRP